MFDKITAIKEDFSQSTNTENSAATQGETDTNTMRQAGLIGNSEIELQ